MRALLTPLLEEMEEIIVAMEKTMVETEVMVVMVVVVDTV